MREYYKQMRERLLTLRSIFPALREYIDIELQKLDGRMG
jgi:hypothetical protein